MGHCLHLPWHHCCNGRMKTMSHHRKTSRAGVVRSELTSLSITYNEISSCEAADDIAMMLQRSCLQEVNLSGNVFEDGAYSPMGTALESSKTTTMRLEDMKIDPTTLD